MRNRSTENDPQQIMPELHQVEWAAHRSATLPPLCYRSERILELERQQLFHAGWVGIGRADRWPAPGDYTAMDLAGVPMIILRDQQARLRAYANSCRHRSSTLLQGSGNCTEIRCPFHCWTYRLDGTLRHAPRMERCEQFALSEFGLIEFELQQQDGFVFVCLGQPQQTLAEYLGDFGDVHWPWALEQLVTARVREMQVNCNWKAFIEVFNEYYHLPYVHPESLRGIYNEPDEPEAVIGAYGTQFGVTEGTAALLADYKGSALPPISRLEGRNATGTRYTWCYPNLTFAACSDSLWMYAAYPLSPDRCQVVQTICFPPAAAQVSGFEQKAQDYYRRYDTALSEDIPFLEQQQIGLSSPFAKPGRFGTLEPGVAGFAAWYAEIMRRAIADAG